QLLCLTFTKAGAAEMANRINAVLARWVRLEDTKLYKELEYLGATPSTAVRERARTLFASVLDCPGGGLRIDTIHAFAQWLLSNFPEEAGLPPGARPMEDRERELLLREVLTELITKAQTTGDTRLLDAITRFTTSKDPAALQVWLARCAGATDLWHGAQGWQRPMDTRVRQLLDMPASADETWARASLHPDLFPDATVAAMLGPLEEWGTKTAIKCLKFLNEWLSIGDDLERRAGALTGFKGTLLKKGDGQPALTLKKPRETHPGFAEGQQLVADAVALAEERQALLGLADFLTSALELGQAFALSWEAAKRRAGLIDFDDLIRTAARLLSDTDASDWIRYKLDRQFNHILIDEAQDTNQAQWDIIEALIDDFFTGEGAAGDTLRTIFTVGDYKQAIFGFQGTSPENFARAREKVFKRIAAAREHADKLPENRRLPTWQPLDLGQSFRTSRPVLDFVNQAIEALGHGAFGLDRPPGSHLGEDGPGLVTLWNPVLSVADDVEGEDEERGWLPTHEIVMAEKIAEKVRRWVTGDEPFVLAKGGAPRHAEAGDIMVLVRKRRELASQIVAKLHDKGIAVAGVDRLRLGAPLAVKDLLAALKFAAQPLDDLSLANLLVSPLIGWSQDHLLAHVPRPKGTRLWDHLRQSDHRLIMPIAEKLRELLRLADFETPQALLAWLLNGPWQGRARLIERLGREANDPLDELLNSAFAYEAVHTPSLVGFIHWF
ncbi:MAG: UvrD-helicase domain-containing protein, partial [Pseudomonadota bacterium]